MNLEAKPKPINWRKIIPVVIVLLIAGYSFGQPYLSDWTGWNLPSINGSNNDGNQNHSEGGEQENDDYRVVQNFPQQEKSGSDQLSKNQSSQTKNQKTAFKLKDLGRDKFQSPAGLEYRRSSHGEHRIDHVMRHAKDSPGRHVHGYFKENGRDEILALIDEAYELVKSKSKRVKKDKVEKHYRAAYTIDMKREIGFKGGKSGKRDGNPALRKLKLIVDNGNQVISAYPVN